MTLMPLSYFRLVLGFCGIAIIATGSMFVLTELVERRMWLGPTAWLEFDGPALLAMLVVTLATLATIILVIVRRARLGRKHG